jgi:hypothetical protein
MIGARRFGKTKLINFLLGKQSCSSNSKAAPPSESSGKIYKEMQEIKQGHKLITTDQKFFDEANQAF